MTGADFCQFTGAFIQNIKEMRFVRYPVLHLCCEIIDTLEGNNSRISITFSKYCKKTQPEFLLFIHFNIIDVPNRCISLLFEQLQLEAFEG